MGRLNGHHPGTVWKPIPAIVRFRSLRLAAAGADFGDQAIPVRKFYGNRIGAVGAGVAEQRRFAQTEDAIFGANPQISTIIIQHAKKVIAGQRLVP